MSTPSGTTVRRRTWSDFGDMRRMPSEYEIVTHNTNWTVRKARAGALEANPSSPANLWFLTYRDRSPLHVEDWNGFRDPDEVTYRRYVTMQDEQETIVASLLEEYADAGHDKVHSPAWRTCLAKLFDAVLGARDADGLLLFGANGALVLCGSPEISGHECVFHLRPHSRRHL